MNYALVATRLLIASALAAGIGAGTDPAPQRAVASAVARRALERARDTGDRAAERAHGWQLLATLTAPQPNGAAAWQSWSTREELFGQAAGAVAATSRPASPSGSSGIRVLPTREGGADDARQVVRRPMQALTVHFNPSAAEHIRANGYASPQVISKLKSDLDERGTPAVGCAISEFPSGAIAVKAIWRVVPAAAAPGEVWVLPAWDPATGDAPARDPNGAYPPAKWDRSVVVDLSGKDVQPDATADIKIRGQSPHPRVVSINRFYHVTLTAEQAANMNASPGDQAILVGLHVATKELPTWVWATFWWHDLPDTGEFAAGKPDAIARSVWGNYLMDIDVGVPRSADPNVARRPVFNPWLEAAFKRGISSNCMSCHQQASLTSELHSAPFSPLRLKPLPDGDPLFRDRIRTDYIWSLSKVPDGL